MTAAALAGVMLSTLVFVVLAGQTGKRGSGPNGFPAADAAPALMPARRTPAAPAPANARAKQPGAVPPKPVGAANRFVNPLAPAGHGAISAALDAELVSGGDGITLPKGPPVEPFRSDPFVPQPRPLEMTPSPVLPPLVIVREPPLPMVIPATVNVIPTSIVAKSIPAAPPEVLRRLSGVLWDGKVYAILETDGKGQRDIVRPGDHIGEDLWVRSITRDQMVLVNEKARAGDQEIIVNLREAPKAAPVVRPPAAGPVGPAPGLPPGGGTAIPYEGL